MRNRIRTPKFKHGSTSAILAVLVIAAIVILNVIAAALAQRYDWMYKDMNKSLVYELGEDYKEYVANYVIPDVERVRDENQSAEKVQIIFCDSEQNLKADATQKYVYGSILDLCEIFGDYIEIDFIDIFEEPSVARSYGVSTTADVVCAFNGKFETINIDSFFILDSTGTDYVAYNGEKMIVAALMSVTQKYTPVCYITANHGEQFSDYQLMLSLIESGYTFATIDLAAEDIPEDCELLITFDPKQDFLAADDVSSVSEVDKLEKYMNNGGKYMIFLSADTFISGARPNLEAFLADWGVSYAHKRGADGIEECYLIKDSSNSTTVDGYTVISKVADNNVAANIMGELMRPSVFGNSGSINIAGGFEKNSDGAFSANINGNERTISPLFVTYASAEAYADGRAVARASDEPFILMSISEQVCDNGDSAYLLASASVEFACEGAMKSASLGNSRAMTMIYSFMGKENAPTSLTIKPFESTDIESLSTQKANSLTLVLALVPAALFGVGGAIVLIRRRYL